MTAVVSAPTVVSTSTKRLVDVLTPEQKAIQVNKLLADLEAATTSSEKKKIRRGLRTRGYYLSRIPKPDAVAAESKANQAQAAEATKELLEMSVPSATDHVKAKGKKGKKAK